jgi:hypothetical protein
MLVDTNHIIIFRTLTKKKETNLKSWVTSMPEFKILNFTIMLDLLGYIFAIDMGKYYRFCCV